MKLLLSFLIFWAFSNPQFEQARTLYYQGADGNNAAYASADKLFSSLYGEHSDEPRIEVYYGSLRLLEASHTWALWKKNSLSKQGIQLMDAAVQGAPSDLEVRFVRAATTYDLPGFFHRKQQSEQDFAYLAERAAEASKTGALEPRLAAASLYYHAEFLREAGKNVDARQFWTQAINLAPKSRAARDSREELKKTG
ncbi:MAG: hypothetical protein M3Y24_02970 [Acidobacteriota bacterium]|nr:hypothetical protein [Acidobacteriota bacterium]